MTDTRYDFTELRRVLANRPRLPETPGLYVAREGGDLQSVSVWLLDNNGFWWRMNHEEATPDEVLAHMNGRELEPLIRKSEADQ